MKVAIVGCGGIGYALAEPVCRTLNKISQTEDVALYLVDGDTVEAGNMERQYFPGAIGQGKANTLAEKLKGMFPEVAVTPVEMFLNPDSIKFHKDVWLNPGVTVLAGVDNNATRAYLEDEAARVRSIVLVLGGNDEISGQASMYIRKNNRDVTPRITTWTPELRITDGKMPGMGTCQRSGSPQTAMSNRAASLCMEILWMNSQKNPMPRINEIRFDLTTAIMKGFWMDPCGAKEERKEGSP
jgi:molybdopterin/thiamine biosynthesis adenylyltransferase